MLFCQCNTQWRYGALGGLIGLDYTGVKAVLDLELKRKRRKAVFQQIQIMERAALNILNKKAEKK